MTKLLIILSCLIPSLVFATSVDVYFTEGAKEAYEAGQKQKEVSFDKANNMYQMATFGSLRCFHLLEESLEQQLLRGLASQSAPEYYCSGSINNN